MGIHKLTINSKAYEVNIEKIDGNKASVSVNGKDYEVQIEKDEVSEKPVLRSVRPVGTTAGTGSAKIRTAEEKVSGKAIKSPLPGVILNLCVKEGESVKRGQKLLVLEAMKMENEIQAENDGTVKSILVQKGESVLEGAKLIIIE